MNEPLTEAKENQVSTGIAGLDNVLCGGLDPDRLYLVEGEPGTGKTTLALQFLLEGARHGEKGLYVTNGANRRGRRGACARSLTRTPRSGTTMRAGDPLAQLSTLPIAGLP
jgi:predicted ATP-dependent serine protease